MYDLRDEISIVTHAQMGNAAALDILVQRYEPLIRSLAIRLTFSRSVLDELMQAGCVGLLFAIRKFDSERQTKLITYAVPWILGEMKLLIRQKYEGQNWSSLDDWTLLEKYSFEKKGNNLDGIDIDSINLRLAVSNLNSEEQKVICLRYYRDKTQKETAALLHRSQTQISRIEHAALDKLRKHLL